MTSKITVPFIQAEQQKTSFFLTVLSAADLVEISYVARRGETEEQGAVQRVLNSTRISGIRDFVLAGGVFPTSVVLNWTYTTEKPSVKGGQLTLPRVRASAQIIDGQHRILGISAAIKENKSIAKFPIPVTLYNRLSTRQCADIFLSINTEQKPVPRSLVFDLYSLASDYIVDPAAVRAISPEN
jgi:DNA sulfur modification protein DndB